MAGHVGWQAQMRFTNVVEMRHFAGMRVDDTAQALSISPDTVERDGGWQRWRCWRS